MNSWFERQFKLSEHGTDVRKEIMAGITTFVTMAYIIFVNPGILSETGMPFGSVLVATCLGASLATFLMAFLANYPFALAPGMGLNAFFAFTVVLGMGIPWQVALAAVFVEGVIFIVLTCTKVREEVVNSIPKTLKIGVSAGIGLFITFIGLQGSGIIVDNPAVLLGLGKLSGNVPALLSILGLLLMVTLEARRVKGGILIGVVVVTVLAIPLGVAKMPEGIVSMPPSLSPIFMKMDFSMLAQPAFWSVTLAFFFVDFFDTVGTLVGVSSRANMLDEKGRLNFPARFREQMGQVFVITRWMDNCLVAFPESEWQLICEKLQGKSMVKTREIQRFLFAMATEVTPDKQGRVLISPSLRTHAGLQKDVTIIGVGKHAEIWDTAAWQEKQAGFGSEQLEAAMEELEL